MPVTRKSSEEKELINKVFAKINATPGKGVTITVESLGNTNYNVHISLKAQLRNNSSDKNININQLAPEMAKQIKQSLEISYIMTDQHRIAVIVSCDIQPENGSQLADKKNGRIQIAIKDNKEIGVPAHAQFCGSAVEFSVKIAKDMLAKKADQAAPHEIAHVLGLLEAKDDTSTKNLHKKALVNNSMEPPLVRSYDVNTKILPEQINRILMQYASGQLNQPKYFPDQPGPKKDVRLVTF